MSRSKHARARSPITYGDACDALTAALAPGARGEMLDALLGAGDFDDACTRLRSAMRSHVFPVAGGRLALRRVVQSFDERTRRAGLHVLESWDYRAKRFADDIAPVLMLEHCALRSVAEERRRAAVAVMLDHYFLSILGLIVARAWDGGDPNENLSRADDLLAMLHGEGGSGTRFVDDAPSLLLLAVSHYHPEEHAYDALLRNAELLEGRHRRHLAMAGAAALGSHLRWGLRYMYRADVGDMRADNTIDYPWLVYSLLTLAREHLDGAGSDASDDDRVRVAECLLNGVTADPWFVFGRTPEWLPSQQAQHGELRDLFHEHRDALAGEFTHHQPNAKAYTPLGFTCNFLCNALVGLVAVELAEPGPHPGLNDLFTRTPRTSWAPGAVERHARRLTDYARGGAGSTNTAALIVYDPYEAAHSYNAAMTVMRQPRAVS